MPKLRGDVDRVVAGRCSQAREGASEAVRGHPLADRLDAELLELRFAAPDRGLEPPRDVRRRLARILPACALRNTGSPSPGLFSTHSFNSAAPRASSTRSARRPSRREGHFAEAPGVGLRPADRERPGGEVDVAPVERTGLAHAQAGTESVAMTGRM